MIVLDYISFVILAVLLGSMLVYVLIGGRVVEKYGWYSAKHAALGGSTAIYTRPDGSEVEVSFVTLDANSSGTKWDDIQCVGPVVKFICDGK